MGQPAAWVFVLVFLLGSRIVAAPEQAPIPTAADAVSSDQPSVAAKRSGRDIWLGVLQSDLALEPAFALVDGKWWADTDEDTDENRNARQRFEIVDRIGTIPPQWLPPGRPLPTIWQAHLFNGHTNTTQLSRAFRSSEFDHLVVDTDLRAPAALGAPRAYPVLEYKGVAVAGSVEVNLFTAASRDKRQNVVRFLSGPILNAERTAIAKAASSSTEDALLWARVTKRMMAAGRFRPETVISSTLRDGSVVYYVEGAKSYSGPPPESDCQVRISATVTQDRAGTLTVRTLWAQPVCDNYVSYEPLAIVERGGATCWLTVREYEDGYDYILTKPGWVSQETASLDCKVR
jgi:hypothetical protein